MNYIYGVVILSIVGLGSYTLTLEAQNAKLKAQIKEAQEALEKQNKALDKLKVDTEAYKKEVETQDKVTAQKYDKVQTQNLRTCEQKLSEIHKALSLFYTKAKE